MGLNGKAESLNSKIRLLRIKARGYRNQERFKTAVILQKQLDEMYTYIRNNKVMILNYGDGEIYWYGEPVTTTFVESTINEVTARRMAKKQQMQWSREGAHYLWAGQNSRSE